MWCIVFCCICGENVYTECIYVINNGSINQSNKSTENFKIDCDDTICLFSSIHKLIVARISKLTQFKPNYYLSILFYLQLLLFVCFYLQNFQEEKKNVSKCDFLPLKLLCATPQFKNER